MGFIYFLVALLATTFGSLVGLGGGVIIKPVLDALGHYDLSTISLLSSFTVFSMSIISTINQWKKGFKFKKRLLQLSFGAIMGGILGKTLFSQFLNLMPDTTAKGIQSILLALLLLIVIFRAKIPHFHIKNVVFVLLIGLLLGTIASFLGIGGGPINVAVLILFFEMDVKEAAVNSILIILLSQFSKLAIISIDTGFTPYNLTMLWFMIPASIIGGLVGTKLNHRLTIDRINQIFIVMVALLVCLNVINAFNFLF